MQWNSKFLHEGAQTLKVEWSSKGTICICVHESENFSIKH